MTIKLQTLVTLKRLSTGWPVLALPFVPVAGKVIGDFLVWVSVAHAALQ